MSFLIAYRKERFKVVKLIKSNLTSLPDPTAKNGATFQIIPITPKDGTSIPLLGQNPEDRKAPQEQIPGVKIYG